MIRRYLRHLRSNLAHAVACVFSAAGFVIHALLPGFCEFTGENLFRRLDRAFGAPKPPCCRREPRFSPPTRDRILSELYGNYEKS